MAPVGPSIFQRHTSAVDWCEPNYVYSSNIAEFFNTVSNVLFFIYPPLLALLCGAYSRQTAVGGFAVWLMLMVVGGSSVYFHATLTMLGQLMDEIAILWVFTAAVCTWVPRFILPIVVQNNVNLFRAGLVSFCLCCTSISWLHPSINAIALMSLVIPSVYIMVYHSRRTKSLRASRLGMRMVVQLTVALICWVTDRLHCSFWLSVGFPYMHAVWHVLIAGTASFACVLYSFFDACEEASHLSPTLLIWPSDEWEYFGLPYVSLKSQIIGNVQAV